MKSSEASLCTLKSPEAELQLAKPLLKSLAARFVKSGLLSHEDAFQEAQLGFLEGMRRFDPAKGASLRVYAQSWVINQLQMACSANLLVHVPMGITKTVLADGHAQKRGLPPLKRQYEASDALKKAAQNALIQSHCPQSLSEAQEDSGENPIAAQRCRAIELELSKNALENAFSIEDQVDASRAVEVLCGLTLVQQRVIYLRFFQDLTLEDTGAILSISREAARLAQNRALAGIRKCLGLDTRGASGG